MSISPGRSVSPSHIELIDAVRRDESRKRLTCKGIALRLHEDVVRHDLHLWHQFLALSSGLESPRASRDIIVLDIDNQHLLGYSPFDGSIDVVDNVSIVFGDVVLDVDNDVSTSIVPRSIIPLKPSASQK